MESSCATLILTVQLYEPDPGCLTPSDGAESLAAAVFGLQHCLVGNAASHASIVTRVADRRVYCRIVVPVPDMSRHTRVL